MWIYFFHFYFFVSEKNKSSHRRCSVKKGVLNTQSFLLRGIKLLNNNINKKKSMFENLTSEVMWHKNYRIQASILTCQLWGFNKNESIFRYMTRHTADCDLRAFCACSDQGRFNKDVTELGNRIFRREGSFQRSI